MALAGCAGFTVLTTGIAGAVYVRSQTVDRTFVATMPEVKEASRQALGDMGFTIKDREFRETDYYILAASSHKYEIEITITPITLTTTKVSINADSLPERDKATGTEVLNQMATILSARAPTRVASTSATAEPPLAQAGPPSPMPSSRASAPENHRPLVAAVPQAPVAPPAPSGSPEPATSTTPAMTRQSPVDGSPGETPKQGGMNGKQVYDAAIRDYVEGDFPAAIAHLQTYLARHPDGTERPRALYWLGESLYSEQEYAQALIQFETVLRDYPQSPEAVRALLRGADASRQLGETHRATTFLKTLVAEHPQSREAQVARSLLAR